MSKTFGIRLSLPDSRDHKYTLKNTSLAEKVDMRQWASPVEDQGDIGSCIGNAVVAAYELMIKQQCPEKFVDASRLYNYYHARYLEGVADYDAGILYVRNAMKALEKFGVCTEILWPYEVEKVTIQPTPNCYVDGMARRIVKYKSLGSSSEILDSLNAHTPVVVAMKISDSFMKLNSNNFVVPTPKSGEIVMGGHAVVAVGYSLTDRQFLMKNSFGTDWGDAGYCWVPFSYIDSYGFDYWCFEITECGLTSPTNPD